MAPRTRSSHMNQKRSWPGVPNRYRIRSWSSVMRPKSMATVVVVLSGAWVRSSIPAEAEVITASVRSGLISETAPTNVVLPTPKPPATTIFAEVVERAAPLELAKSTEHPFEQCHVRLAAGGLVAAGLVNGDEPGLGQVGYEDPGDAEGDGEQCGDLGDRLDLAAQVADPLALGQLALELDGIGRGVYQCLDGELVPGPGPAPGHGVRAHQGVMRASRGGRFRSEALRRLYGLDAGWLRWFVH